MHVGEVSAVVQETRDMRDTAICKESENDAKVRTYGNPARYARPLNAPRICFASLTPEMISTLFLRGRVLCGCFWFLRLENVLIITNVTPALSVRNKYRNNNAV